MFLYKCTSTMFFFVKFTDQLLVILVFLYFPTSLSTLLCSRSPEAPNTFVAKLDIWTFFELFFSHMAWSCACGQKTWGHTHLFSLELFCLLPIFQRLSKLYIYFRKFVCISFYFNQLSPVKTVSWLTLEI